MDTLNLSENLINQDHGYGSGYKHHKGNHEHHSHHQKEKIEKYTAIEDARRNENIEIAFDSHHAQKWYDHFKQSQSSCPFMQKYYQIIGKTHSHDSPFYENPVQTLNQTQVADGVPTAVFHGFGDACFNPGMGSFMQQIQNGTNGKVLCIEVGHAPWGEVFNNFETIAEKSCSQLAAHPDFQGEFNVVGLS